MERNSHGSFNTSTNIQDIAAWKYAEEQHQFLSTILHYVNDSVIVTDL
jgi:hypothetical protein